MAYNITLEGKNKVIAERMLKNVATLFDRCKIDYWIEGGTLLGIKRDQEQLLCLCKYCGQSIKEEFYVFDSSELRSKSFYFCIE